MGISLQDHAREISKIYAKHEKEISALSAENTALEENVMILRDDQIIQSSENSRLVEIAQEAYEADHSGSFKDWCDMIGYRLTTDSVSTRLVENRKIWGELYIDDEGKANLDCHIHSSVKFEEAEADLRKFIALFQDKIDRKDECPLHIQEKGQATDE